jgi:hypothetical protein
MFHALEMDPRVYAFDKATDDELFADQVEACGSTLTTMDGVAHVCFQPTGHGGVCEWARAPAPSPATRGREP